MSFLLEAFILGLSMAPLCLANCGPLAAPLLIAGKPGWRAASSTTALFMAGRLAGYLGIGTLSALLGHLLLPGRNRPLTALLTLAAGLLLLLAAAARRFPSLSGCRFLARPGAAGATVFFLGLASGLNLCPPFVAALLSAAVLPSLARTLLFFLAFFIATSLVFPVLILLGWVSDNPAVQAVGRILLVMNGIWMTGKGAALLFI